MHDHEVGSLASLSTDQKEPFSIIYADNALELARDELVYFIARYCEIKKEVDSQPLSIAQPRSKDAIIVGMFRTCQPAF